MKDYKGILIYVEQHEGTIHKVSYELINKAKELCKQSNAPLCCLVLGDEGIDVKGLNYCGADKVFYMKDRCFENPEEYLFKENIVKFVKEYKPETILIGATNFGRSLAPRIAAALKIGLTADCTDLKVDGDGKLIQVRPAFSNNIFAHIKSKGFPQMATVRYKEFNEAERNEKRDINVSVIEPYVRSYDKISWIQEFKKENFDITEAEVVVAAGRGIKKAEDLHMLEELASLLGGKIGASRALVDAGMIGSAHQIGYSGNRVKPKIYIACGISGAPQHIAGMKESEVIVAINSDPSAPIFNIADYGYVGDLYEVIPKMIEEINSTK
ncbi:MULTISPECIES: electron transfer flavoprotein subunit alpha/FixB family protein [Clostridium]|uniref:Acryloyl-CoA reductase electron transfer subunit beta n=1 Tax=Clostridium ragsdalei P11 TaxID=1353534 RepID=A0A1A6AX80_9CLOT|nr:MULTISPECIES: electron transfer flavoprotein subunit alpha/FixB family protein [Clostridium]OBR94657.1 acryloyl-CoA reductase electron transfer subunit beta [Clostridium ragsdalei P11]QXE20625.1 electron transfer flavoprotein, alpha subunit [Clostridium sp. 001]